MTDLFVDTNILIDILARRKPYHWEALRLFEQAEKKQVRLHTTAISITTAWYMLNKYGDAKIARKAIAGMMNYVHIIPVSHRAVAMALRSDFKDLEDGVQHFAALEAGNIEAIITRNLRDFRHSLIRVCTAGDCLDTSG
ncbi:MAG: PIN domain-containing protein [Balneolales bacterium]